MEIINDIGFANPNLGIQSASDRDSIHPIRWDFDWSETPNVRYLHHHESDGADTLRFDSTDEYFKIVEYEEQRSTELRDIEWKPFGSAELFRPQPSPQTLFFQIVSFVWAEITFIWNFVMVGSTSKSL